MTASDSSSWGAHTLSTFNILVASTDATFVDEVTAHLKPFGYGVETVGDSLRALEKVRSDGPDLVLAEVELPPLSGFDLCHAIKRDPALLNTPLILVTDSYFDEEAKARGLGVGADDLLYRPLHAVELRARVRASLKANAYIQRILKDRHRLEEIVKERTSDIEQVTLGVVAALERANTMNDTDTGGHLHRVSAYSELLAVGLKLDPTLSSKIHRFSSLHDVGKVGLPDSILKKEGKLTDQEYNEMKLHARLGFEILNDAKADPVACRIALFHHEKFDGSGYPQALTSNVIPVEARIVAVADVYDALTTRRCYKDAMPSDEAATIILKESGKHFDPAVVRIFMQSYDCVVGILNEHGD